MESNSKITKKELTKLSLRTGFVCLTFNYERMMAPGFTFIQLPLLKKIYKDDKKGLSDAMCDNMEFINTHPNFTGFLSALLLSLEEGHESREIIKGIKTALYAPLAGIGDAFFWFTLLPIMAGICGSFAVEGNIIGPILFALVYFIVFLSRIPLTHLGYTLGTKSLSLIKENADKISRSASIVGISVIGGLIATYISLALTVSIPLNKGIKLDLQSELIDKIFPNLLAIGYVAILYYLLKKKNVSPVILIFGTFVFVLCASFLGIM
ncbi:MAG: PTS system mannose/fructose/sorbose family transporter subunit IID [Bacilli bacterium]